MKKRLWKTISLLSPYILIQAALYIYFLISGIKTEILNKTDWNGFGAYVFIVPSVSLLISLINYIFVKIKLFTLYTTTFTLFITSIGEYITWKHYRTTILDGDMLYFYTLILGTSLIAYIHSAIFKSICSKLSSENDLYD